MNTDWLRKICDRHRAERQFAVAGTVTMPVNVSDRSDDFRRLRAEAWCQSACRGRWLRRVDTQRDLIHFEFECVTDAALFKLNWS